MVALKVQHKRPRRTRQLTMLLAQASAEKHYIGIKEATQTASNEGVRPKILLSVPLLLVLSSTESSRSSSHLCVGQGSLVRKLGSERYKICWILRASVRQSSEGC